MKTAAQLKQQLQEINRRSYPAYKGLAGVYQFATYQLSIDHVQGDPFAAPSALHIWIDHKTAGFPASLYDGEAERVALQDYLIRQFGRQINRFCYQAKGSGKSGLISVTRCGQEILERTACAIDGKGITLRFEVGFPANGRTINSGELEKILFDFLPKCVEQALIYRNLPKKKVEEVYFLAQDQTAIRQELKNRNLVAFVANGAILPRESGVSDLPMKEAVPFQSPESLQVTLSLPHRGAVTGMGIPKGITLIAGGGYHGKSTLLQALERGVYNHVDGDGRELVITDDSALKLRAEEGRKVTDTDISLFINDLPSGKDTRSFSTLDASGSTSQAANIIEGIGAGSRVFLIDEDTSATNFMIRDELMQQIIAREKEPITPFLERARDLYEQSGISTILVVGSSGSYFHIADVILQMDNYQPFDITAKVKEVLKNHPAPVTRAPGYRLPEGKRQLHLGASTAQRKSYRGDKVMTERLKVKTMGKDVINIGKETLDLRYMEQLVDREQTAALAYMLRYAKEHYQNRDIDSVVQALTTQIREKGVASVCDSTYVPAGLALPRVQEIYGCFNRY